MNASAEVEKLLVWLCREAKQGAGIVTLTHQNVGGVGAALGKWPVAEEDDDNVRAQLAQDVYRAACVDADGQLAPGAQQYVALFFAEPDLRTFTSRLPFYVMPARQAALGPPGEGIATEPPTPSGFVAQVMRHAESSQQHGWQIIGHALGMIERHATTMAAENQRLQQHNFDLVRGYEGLLSERHVRELSAQIAMHEREEKSQFYQRLWQFAPLIAAKLGVGPNGMMAPAPRALAAPPPAASTNGASAGPQAPAPTPVSPPNDASISEPLSAPSSSASTSIDAVLAPQLRELLSTLTPEQLMALQGSLSSEQMLALGQIWSTLDSAGASSPAAAPTEAP